MAQPEATFVTSIFRDYGVLFGVVHYGEPFIQFYIFMDESNDDSLSWTRREASAL